MRKYIDFVPTGRSKSGKTKIWEVVTSDDDPIGAVKWFGQWRQYSFYPAPLTIFERGCLREIADFCEQATRDQRKK